MSENFFLILGLVPMFVILVGYLVYNTKAWIIFMIVYLPFETVILNLTPDGIISYVRYLPEFFSYFVLFISLLKFVYHKKKYDVINIDKLIILLLSYSVLNLLVNNVNVTIFFMGLRWIIRYVVIYFIIRLNEYILKDVKKIVSILFSLGGIEIIIGFLQIPFRTQLDPFLKPKELNIGLMTISVVQGDSTFSIYGTLGRYAFYAYFLSIIVLLAICYYLYVKKTSMTLLFILISIVALVLSYSRQTIMALLVVVPILLKYRGKITFKRKSLIIFPFLLIVSCIGLMFMLTKADLSTGSGVISEGVFSRYFSIFSKEFIAGDYNGQGRTYFYTTALKILLSKKPLFGFGIGMFATRPAIELDQSVHLMLGIPTKFSMDVYWTSIVGQMGLIGFFILVSIFFVTIKNYKKIFYSTHNSYIKFISLFVVLLVFVMLVQSFFGSNFSDRTQSLYLWVFIGLTYHVKKIADLDKSKNAVVRGNNNV